MGRPKGTTDLTESERERIRDLFRQGVRIQEIARIAKRGEWVIYGVTRGMKRKRPPPPSGRHAERNDRILRMIEKGMSHAEIGRRLEVSARSVGLVVAGHPHIAWLLQKRKLRPATVAKRYRLELSTVLRILRRGGKVQRTREGQW